MSFCKCMVLFILIKSKIYSFKINTFSWWRDVLNQFNRVAASDIVSDEFSKASSIMPAWWESSTSPSCEILHWNLKASWAITFECGQSLQLKRQNTWSGWKSYLLKVSLSVVVIFFPRTSHFCVHETCPAFAGSTRGAGDGSGGPAQLVASGGKHNPGARTAPTAYKRSYPACV